MGPALWLRQGVGGRRGPRTSLSEQLDKYTNSIILYCFVLLLFACGIVVLLWCQSLDSAVIITRV